jgi:hypothetical protein
MPPTSNGSLFLRLSNRRRGDLLEYFQQIEFVPMLDQLSFKRAYPKCLGLAPRRTRSSLATTRPIAY